MPIRPLIYIPQLLPFYIIMEHMSNLSKCHELLTELQTLFLPQYFALMFLFCSMVHSRHHIAFGCHLSHSPLAYERFLLFLLFFMIFDSFEEHWPGFLSCPSVWFYLLFLMIKLKEQVQRKTRMEVKYHCHHVSGGTWYPQNMVDGGIPYYFAMIELVRHLYLRVSSPPVGESIYTHYL